MTEKLSQEAATYDAMFEAGGHSGVFDLQYWRSPYLPLFKAVRREIIRSGVRAVLEVGCGTGALAHLLLATTSVRYRGFDFSTVAVDKAKNRTGLPELFFCGGAGDIDCYRDDHDAVVCTEVLEHVPDDKQIVARWKAGRRCICSVPNFDSPYHERYFATPGEVMDRYGGLIEIERILRIKKPVIDDLAWSNRFRQFRWNRYRPRRLLELAGLGDFDAVGGWFLFIGTKKLAADFPAEANTLFTLSDI
jgi:SAM-dependent methyltransferase